MRLWSVGLGQWVCGTTLMASGFAAGRLWKGDWEPARLWSAACG
ncbi:hypothetical protein CGSMWGv00703C2mash_01859 [Gardnerella pickettii 00703C2mash]|nr:hypothetical protein CGSMWGv00703C2mash_01859 [Gardnerella pickettii 00703C2mash]